MGSGGGRGILLFGVFLLRAEAMAKSLKVRGLLKGPPEGGTAASIPLALFGLTLAVTTTAIAVNEVSQKINGQWKDNRGVLLGRDRVKGLKVSQLQSGR